MENTDLNIIFSEVSGRYEQINHIMTLGLDVKWRRRAAEIAAQDGGSTWLDICSGTGEMAIDLGHLADGNTMIISADFSIEMIREAVSKPKSGRICFLISEAKVLPFRDETFDLVTISFATRNININRQVLIRTLREFHRVLKPGGRLVNLETSQPASKVIRKIFQIFIISSTRAGGLVSGSGEGYGFLYNSMRHFHGPEELVEIFHDAGFRNVSYEKLSFGAVAIHKAVK
jgi:demethylmenaquinone methyltransferase/2-methoxy-6-polyprenyl-1,4-benzoquinol methylase